MNSRPKWSPASLARCLLRPAPRAELLEYFRHEHATAELGIILKELQKRGFPGWADGAQGRDIDDEFTAVKMLLRLHVLTNEFSGPGLDELAFDHQPPSARALHDRDLQHAYLALGVGERNTRSEVLRATTP